MGLVLVFFSSLVFVYLISVNKFIGKGKKFMGENLVGY